MRRSFALEITTVNNWKTATINSLNKGDGLISLKPHQWCNG